LTLLRLADLRQSGRDFPNIGVEYVAMDVPRVYAESVRGQKELPDFPVELRRAVAVARRLQCPEGEFAALFSMDDDVLCLHMHPLQGALNRGELRAALYAEVMTAVNDVGVDLNVAAQNSHYG